VLKVGVAIVSEIARKTFCLMISAVDSFVVLSLMLRPSFPSLRCYAFEPPGCIFDEELSEDSTKWITSIVRHDDVGE